MRLHENEVLFKQAIKATSDLLSIPEIYIEKDYWVTVALKAVFTSNCKEYVVFKGGTALSKCYKIIDRFSEDIDLNVLTDEDETGSQSKRKLQSISEVVAHALPEVNIPEVTRKKGQNRKTAHEYKKLAKGGSGNVRDFICLESTVFGHHEPSSIRSLSSYIHDMMLAKGQQTLIDEYQLEPFELSVLDPKRTICEKIMSLVRFSYSDRPIDDLKLKIRHFYDLHKLLEIQELREFMESPEFDIMLLDVAHEDARSFKSNNSWLNHHPAISLTFKDPANIWLKLKEAYLSSFRDMVYGDFPNEADILKTQKSIAQRLESINWNLNNLK